MSPFRKRSKSSRSTLPLPHELVVEILSRLDDKRNARLVCKDFAAAGLPSLTNGIVRLSNFRGDLDRLIEISKNEVLSKHIKTAECYTPAINGCCTATGNISWDEWWAESWIWDPLLHRRVWLRARKKETYREYLALYEQQLNYSDELLEELVDAFKRLPNITTIRILDDHLSSDRFMPRAVEQVEDVPPFWGKDTHYLMFNMAIRAASLAQLQIRALRVGGPGFPVFNRKSTQVIGASGISDRILTQSSDADFEHMRWVFKSCQQLQLLITSHDDEREWREETYCGPKPLASLFNSIQHLRHLEIKTRSSYAQKPVSLDIGRLLSVSKHPWPNLTNFALQSITIQCSKDLAIFLGHRKMQIVHLKSVSSRTRPGLHFCLIYTKKG